MEHLSSHSLVGATAQWLLWNASCVNVVAAVFTWRCWWLLVIRCSLQPRLHMHALITDRAGVAAASTAGTCLRGSLRCLCPMFSGRQHVTLQCMQQSGLPMCLVKSQDFQYDHACTCIALRVVDNKLTPQHPFSRSGVLIAIMAYARHGSICATAAVLSSSSYHQFRP
jgi:hypothetical protein